MPYKTPEEAAAHWKTYIQQPGVKERIKRRRQQPRVKARRLAHDKVYRNTSSYYLRPDIKEQRKKKHWTRQLLNRYGLTPENFYSMFADQGGVCAICGTSDWGPKGPEIDHDHIGNIVRGILCIRCNTAIGLLREDSRIIRTATKYLEKNKMEVKESGY
jgi:hypothetical protein